MMQAYSWSLEKGELTSLLGKGPGSMVKVSVVSCWLKPWESKIIPMKSWSHPHLLLYLPFFLFFTHIGLQCLELSMFFLSAVFRCISYCVPVPILSSVWLWFSLHRKSQLKCNFLGEAFLMPYSRSGFLCYKLSRAQTLSSKALAIIYQLSW